MVLMSQLLRDLPYQEKWSNQKHSASQQFFTKPLLCTKVETKSLNLGNSSLYTKIWSHKLNASLQTYNSDTYLIKYELPPSPYSSNFCYCKRLYVLFSHLQINIRIYLLPLSLPALHDSSLVILNPLLPVPPKYFWNENLIMSLSYLKFKLNGLTLSSD